MAPRSRRPPSAAAQAGVRVKKACRDLGLRELHVTSDRYSRVVTVEWTDGPTEAAVRQKLTGLHHRITVRRHFSDAAALDALQRFPDYGKRKHWLATGDLTVLGPWAIAAAEVAAGGGQQQGESRWRYLTRVQRCTSRLSEAQLATIAQLLRDGTDEPLERLVQVALALG